MHKLTVVIPSYHRDNFLKNSIIEFGKLADSLKKYDIVMTTSVYRQAATPMECSELSTIIHNVPEYDPSVTIGTIKKDAILKCVDDFDNGYILLMDDDIGFNESINFNDLARELSYIISKDYDVLGFSMNKAGNHTTFKEMNGMVMPLGLGIMFKARYAKPILTSEADVLECGEDSFMFLKALVLNLSVRKVIGLSKFMTHLGIEGTDLSGGIAEMARRKTNVKTSFGNRHNSLHALKKSVQFLYPDFYHYDSMFSGRQKLRPDLIGYIRDNVKLDSYGNISRRLSIMSMDGSHRSIYFSDAEKSYAEFQEIIDRMNNA